MSTKSVMKNGHKCRSVPRNTCPRCKIVFKSRQQRSRHCKSCPRQLVPFGHEDLSNLNVQGDVALRCAIQHDFLNALDLVHFNSNYPENCNIRKTNIKNDKIEVLSCTYEWQVECLRQKLPEIMLNVATKLGYNDIPPKWQTYTAASLRTVLKRPLRSTSAISAQYDETRRLLLCRVDIGTQSASKRKLFDNVGADKRTRTRELYRLEVDTKREWGLPETPRSETERETERVQLGNDANPRSETERVRLCKEELNELRESSPAFREESLLGDDADGIILAFKKEADAICRKYGQSEAYRNDVGGRDMWLRYIKCLPK